MMKGTHMKLNPISTNQTELEIGKGVVVFFSYKTPVAAFVPGAGYLRTNHKWSRTTSKHINQWLRRMTGTASPTLTEVDQSVLDTLVGGI
jgi:hypothetical protein